jgi:hypothetical protein
VTGKSAREPVKILVHTKAEDGYPPEEWEGLWAIPIGGGRFKIDNIPFYAKNLSCDDIVAASNEGGEYIFTSIVEPSENSTIRVVIYDLDDEKNVRDFLVALGCSIEAVGTPGLIAINIPKTAMNNALKFLENAFSDQRLDFEEGALR